jgi:hypothetical protein
MIYIQGVLFVLGFVLCFSGNNLFETSRPVGGGILGSTIGIMVGISLREAGNPSLTPIILAGVIGAVIGALLAAILYTVIITLASGVLGGFIGSVAGFIFASGGNTHSLASSSFSLIPDNNIQMAAMLVFVAIGIILSIVMKNIMPLVATAFIGSFIAATAAAEIGSIFLPILGNNIFIIFAWIIIGWLGLIVQNNNQE